MCVFSLSAYNNKKREAICVSGSSCENTVDILLCLCATANLWGNGMWFIHLNFFVANRRHNF